MYPTRGTYFVVTDVAPLGFDDGAAFCWRLPELIGVAAVPVSVFCADPDLGRTLVRFAFCKRDEVLAEAVSRLGLDAELRHVSVLTAVRTRARVSVLVPARGFARRTGACER